MDFSGNFAAKTEGYSLLINIENTLGRKLTFSKGDYFLLTVSDSNARITVEVLNGIYRFSGSTLVFAKQDFTISCATDRLLTVVIEGDIFRALCFYLSTDIYNKTPLGAVGLSTSACNDIIKQVEASLLKVENEGYSFKKQLIFEIVNKYFTGGRFVNSSSKNKIPDWLDSLYTQMHSPANFTKGVVRMVELSGKTPEHLSRCFKKHYLITPTEFINGLRMKNSAKLLIETDASIMDICFENGYQNISWFNSLFKETFGVSPTEYRQSHRK